MKLPKLAYTFNGIIWNEVTWYSKLAAIVVCFGVIPALSFYIGKQYQLTLNALEASANASYADSSDVRKDIFPAYVRNIRLRVSSKGPLPIVSFDLVGNPPLPKEQILVDLVDSQTGDSISILKAFQMGLNEIDLNSDASGITNRHYFLRIIYYVPGGVLANTRVAAVSQSFELP